jgi:hypothetical protein
MTNHSKLNPPPQEAKTASWWRRKLGRKAIKTDTRTLALGDYLTPSPAAASAGRRLDQRHRVLGHDAQRHPGRLHHRRRGTRRPGVDRQHRHDRHRTRLHHRELLRKVGRLRPRRSQHRSRRRGAGRFERLAEERLCRQQHFWPLPTPSPNLVEIRQSIACSAAST